MSWLMPDCKETHRLVAEGMDRSLRPVERMRIRVHLWMCASCTNFSGQMEMLRSAIRKYPGPDGRCKHPAGPRVEP